MRYSTPHPGQFLTCLVTIFFLLTSTASADAKGDATDSAAGQKYALLVGVRQYDVNELRNLRYTEQDVEELARSLQDVGYRRENVVTLTQTRGATEARFLPLAGNIRQELKLLLAKRREHDTVLVALSGHGVQFAGSEVSYYCPADAKLADRKTLIPLDQLYDDLERCPAGFKLLLVDACRNDPQSDHSRARSEVVLQSVTRPPKRLPAGGVAALYSCSPGERAYEHADLKHGVFFHFIIRALRGEADANRDRRINLPELELYTKQRVLDFVRDAYGKVQMPDLQGKVQGLVPLATLDTAAAYSNEGKQFLKQKEYDRAIEAFSQAIRLDPADKRLYHNRGLSFARKGDYLRATVEYDESLRIDPNFALAHYSRGSAFEERGEYNRAVADYGEAIRINPKDAGAYLARGLAHRQLGDHDAAIADYTEAIRVKPGYSLAYNNRGFVFERRQELDRALADYTEAIHADPSSWRALRNRGNLYRLKKDHERALADLDESIRLNSQEADTFNNRGLVHRDLKDYDRAIAEFDNANKVDPRNFNAFINRAGVYVTRKELEQAIAEYSQAIRLDAQRGQAYHGKLAAAHNSLGCVWHNDKHDHARARIHFDEAIRWNPKLSSAFFNRGQLYYAERQYDEALAEYAEAIRLNPKYVRAYTRRGDALFAQAQYVRAEAKYAEALQLDPNDASARMGAKKTAEALQGASKLNAMQ